MKKNITILGALLLSTIGFSQVIISDDLGTATDKTSVLLEFANTDDRGLALPMVRTLPSAPTEGTILLDATTAGTARVKYYNGTWVDLSGQGGDVTSALANQPITNGTTVKDEGKAIIGSENSSADGVLVLESANKAMVLPVVTDYLNIKNPAPGMMAFLKPTTGSAHYRLIVFNGQTWSFWKP